MSDIENIVSRHAVPRGWPADLARQYLTHHLRFDVGDQELAAIRLFHALAADEGILRAARALNVFGE